MISLVQRLQLFKVSERGVYASHDRGVVLPHRVLGLLRIFPHFIPHTYEVCGRRLLKLSATAAAAFAAWIRFFPRGHPLIWH